MKLREPLYIVAGARTPYSKMGTLLADKAADELGRLASVEVLARTGFDPAQIEEVIFGCVAQPAESANVGRVIGLRAGVPQQVPGITVHRNCASGFEAVTQAAEKMNAGRGDVFLVGGAENMSQVPLLYSQTNVKKFGAMARAKTTGDRVKAMLAFRPGELMAPVIGLQLGLTDPVCGLNMGQTAENIARDFKISRQEADEFSMRSHHRAIAAREKLREEIVPALLSAKNGDASVMQDDNGPREGQSMEALGKLKPVFEKGTGIVTAGNASQITDGAVALLVMSEAALKKSGLQPLGRLVAFDYAGCDPTRMGLGPVFALNRVEQQTGLKLKDADLIEINEAFAAQVIGCQRAAKSDEFGRKYLGRDGALGEIPDEILNVNGGAVALGHPVGSSGARLVLTALKELKRRNGKRAVVTLCVGGGQGGALWLETV
ncbi:MAG: acetyl-CoA C-acyltransferase [Verrucomicrobia bacterium]|nr:acetyl-CoA C-acyltransferase [Verrucomicrobiota bacterium]